jgi:hypothetical protein
MEFLGITCSDSIRGVLGVEEEELQDSIFTSTFFDIELRIEIEGWLPETIALVISKAAAATEGYDSKLELLKLCGQYYGALVIYPHLQLGSAAEFTDGQNAFKRHKEALEKATTEATSRAEKYKDLLLAAYDASDTDITSFFGSASPTYDPVTDETT